MHTSAYINTKHVHPELTGVRRWMTRRATTDAVIGSFWSKAAWSLFFFFFLFFFEKNSIKYTVLHIINQLHFCKVQINFYFSLDATVQRNYWRNSPWHVREWRWESQQNGERCSCFFKSLISNLFLSTFVAEDEDVSLYALEATLAPFLCFQGSVFGFECLQFLNWDVRCFTYWLLSHTNRPSPV